MFARYCANLFFIVVAMFCHSATAGPVVRVDAMSPGANVQTVVDTIAAPIEKQVTGVENARWLRSRSRNDGSYSLLVAFEEGIDPHLAQALVRERVKLAMPILPAAAVQRGITVSFATLPGRILVLRSADLRYDAQYLYNLARLNVLDQVQRAPSVGRVELVGPSALALHVYVDAEKLSAPAITIVDVKDALSSALADQPEGTELDLDRLQQTVLKTMPGGKKLHLSDVARLQVTGGKADGFAHLSGMPAVAVAIWPAVDNLSAAGAAELSNRVTSIRSQFPEGVRLDDFYSGEQLSNKNAPVEFWSVEASFPATMTLEQTARSLDKVEAGLRQIPGVKATLVLSQDPFAAFQRDPCIILRFEGITARDRNRVREDIRRHLHDIPGIAARIAHLPPGGENDALEMALVGKQSSDFAGRSQSAAALAQRLRKDKELVDVWCDAGSESPSALVELNREDASAAGVRLADIFANLQAMEGIEVGHVQRLQQNLPVRLELDLTCTAPELRFGKSLEVKLSLDSSGKHSFEKVASIKVHGKDGKLIAIEKLCKVREVFEPSHLDRFNLDPMVELYALPAAGASPAQVWATCVRAAAEVGKEPGLPAVSRLQWLSSRPEPKAQN
jgi:multidrug efflux pump subunit AcrB